MEIFEKIAIWTNPIWYLIILIIILWMVVLSYCVYGIHNTLKDISEQVQEHENIRESVKDCFHDLDCFPLHTDGFCKENCPNYLPRKQSLERT